jgi:hypothetical protein
MDSFTRYAQRPTSNSDRLTLRDWLSALAVVGFFFLAHLDLIIWGALP